MYSQRKHKRRERTPHKTNAQYLATDGVVKILRLARGCETDNDRNNREYKCQQRASVHFGNRKVFLCGLFEGRVKLVLLRVLCEV